MLNGEYYEAEIEDPNCVNLITRINDAGRHQQACVGVGLDLIINPDHFVSIKKISD